MRVKFSNSIALCKRIEIYNDDVLRITTLTDSVVYVHCIDKQEAEDLYNEAYVDGYINVSTRTCRWYSE